MQESECVHVLCFILAQLALCNSNSKVKETRGLSLLELLCPMVLLSRGCPEHPVRNPNHLGSSDKHWHLASFHFLFSFSDYFPFIWSLCCYHATRLCAVTSRCVYRWVCRRGLHMSVVDRRKQLAPRISDDAPRFSEIYFQSNSAYSTSHSEL